MDLTQQESKLGILDQYKDKILKTIPTKIFIKLADSDDPTLNFDWNAAEETEVEPTQQDLETPSIDALNLMKEPHVAWIYKDGRIYAMKSDEIMYDHEFIARKYKINFNHERDPAGRISINKDRMGVWFFYEVRNESPYDDALMALYNGDYVDLNTKVQFSDGKVATVHQLLREITNKDEDTGFNIYSQMNNPVDFRNFYGNIIKLHELWYKINQLDNKLSSRADKLKTQYKSYFFHLIPFITKEFVDVFNGWLDMHDPDDAYTDFDIYENIQDMMMKLTKLKNSSDINEIMSTLSLALNMAHHTNTMHDNFMTDEEFEQLSNLDTSKWDEEIKHIARKN